VEVGVLTSVTGDVLSNPLVADVATKVVSNSLVEQAAVATTSNVAQAAVSETTTTVDTVVSIPFHLLPSLTVTSSNTEMLQYFISYCDSKSIGSSIDLDELLSVYSEWFDMYIKPLVNEIAAQKSHCALFDLTHLKSSSNFYSMLKYVHSFEHKIPLELKQEVADKLHTVITNWVSANMSQFIEIFNNKNEYKPTGIYFQDPNLSLDKFFLQRVRNFILHTNCLHTQEIYVSMLYEYIFNILEDDSDKYLYSYCQKCSSNTISAIIDSWVPSKRLMRLTINEIESELNAHVKITLFRDLILIKNF
jgi:hypothetical protein